MTNEQVYSLGVERLLGIEIPERAKYIRSNYKSGIFFSLNVIFLFSINGRNDTYS